MGRKRKDPKKHPPTRETIVKAWVTQILRTFDYDTKDYMAEEVAVQFPSPHETQDMDIPQRAKDLRWDLLQRIEDAPDREAARGIMLEFADALENG